MASVEIATLEDDQYFKILTENDISVVLKKLKQLYAIKDVLKRMHSFHENAVRFAKLEAAALVRVVELDGLKNLKGSTLGLAKWLSGLSQDQRDRYIKMCEEGLTIYQVWKREISNPDNEKHALFYIRNLSDKLISCFEDSGIVDLKSLSQEAKTHLDDQTANDVIDGVRRRIRQVGGVGIGDGSTVYVLPSSAPTKSQKAAIKTRVLSICSDVKRLQEIVSISGAYIFPYEVNLTEDSCDPVELQLFNLFESIGAVKAGRKA